MMRLAVVSLVSLMLATGASAEIYKWIDAEGNVHYGEHPPLEAQRQTVEPARGPSDESINESRERWQAILSNQRRSDQLGQEDKAKAEEEKAAQMEREAAKQRSCIRARENLNILTQERPVYQVDEKGERIFFDDAAREREIAEMKKIIEEYCP